MYEPDTGTACAETRVTAEGRVLYKTANNRIGRFPEVTQNALDVREHLTTNRRTTLVQPKCRLSRFDHPMDIGILGTSFRTARCIDREVIRIFRSRFIRGFRGEKPDVLPRTLNSRAYRPG